MGREEVVTYTTEKMILEVKLAGRWSSSFYDLQYL